MIIDNFTKFLHGGDYNPDQWLGYAGVIDEDFRLMDKVYCNTFSVGIFSWSQLEPTEGNFTWGWLDDIFDRAERSEKKLFLATPSAARPAWLAKKYHDTNQAGRDGRRMAWQGRQSACLHSPILREKVATINRLLAQRYAGRTALAGWHISNEYSSECWCPLCLEKFAGFLKERYGTLDNLNAHYWSAFWSHGFTDWNQPSPLDGALGAVHLDWKRYLTRVHADFMRMEIAAVREFSVAKITTNMMGLHGLFDWREISKLCDFIADDNYPFWKPGQAQSVASYVSLMHDMHYSMLNKPFLLMESCPGVPNYCSPARMRRPGEFEREMLLALAHGADGTMYFQWRKGRGGCEQFHGAVVGHDSRQDTRTFRDVADYGQRLDAISEVVGSVRKPEVALILDWEARWGMEFAPGFGSDRKKTDDTIAAHYRALWQYGADTAVIGANDDFSPYRIVVAPMLFLLGEGVAERIAEFVAAGGTFVGTYFLGYVDTAGRAILGGSPAGPALQKVFAMRVEDIDGLLPETQQSLSYCGKSYAVSDFAEYIHTEGCEVLATYDAEFYAGRPAITRNSHGKGQAIYIAARTGLDFLQDFYRTLLVECGIAPALAGLPEKVHATKRSGTDADYYFLLNFSDEEQTCHLPIPMLDIWNGEQEKQYTIKLPPVGVSVLKI